MADKLKERIGVLEEAEALAESRGQELKPEAQAELDAYRKRGLAKTSSTASTGVPAVEERKANSFLIRAMGANKAYEAQGVGPRTLVGQGFADSAPNLLNSLPGVIGNSSKRQVADSAQNEFIAATLRQDSGAAIPEPEIEAQRRIYFPMPGDGADVIEQKRQARVRALQGLYVSAGRAVTDDVKNEYQKEVPQTVGVTTLPGTPTAPGGTPGAGDPAAGPATPPIAPSPNEALRDPNAPAAIPQAKVTTTPEAQMVPSDLDKKLTVAMQAAFNSGKSIDELDQLAKSFGYSGASPSLAEAVKSRDRGVKGIQISPPRSQLDTPTTAQKVLGPALGTDAGIAAAGTANGLSMGALDEIGGTIDSAVSGKPLDQAIAEADAKKAAARAANPTAYGLGEVAGTAGSAMLLGPSGKLSTFAPRGLAFDAGYGGLTGFNENNADRTSGAMMGAPTGLAGGIVGRAIPNVAGGLIGGNPSPEVQFLRSKGVRTTLGQNMGETAGKVEEKLTSIPLVGDLIGSSRKRAAGDFQRGYVDDALSHINDKLPADATDKAAMGYAQKSFNNAYDTARSGMSMTPDATFQGELTALGNHLASGAVDETVAKRVATIANNQIAGKLRASGGVLSGDDYKDVMSQISKISANARKSQNFELADSLDDLSSIVDGAARRSSPPEAVAAMDAADTGYAKFVRAEKAAAMKGGDTGTFSPSQLSSAVQNMDNTVRSKAFLRGDALGQDWADAGKKVLGDKVANSGTADRLGAMGLAGLAGYASPKTALPLAGLATVYAPGVRDAVSAVSGRTAGPGAQAVGNFLKDRAYIPGTLTGAGTPLLLPYASGTQ